MDDLAFTSRSECPLGIGRWPRRRRPRRLHSFEGGVMAPGYPSTTTRETACLETACLDASSSFQTPDDERQKGHAGFAYRALSHAHWLTDLPWVSRLAELSAFAGACSVTNSARLRDCRPNAAHLASKPGFQLCAYLAFKHLSKRPFQSRLNCWFKKCQQGMPNNWESLPKRRAA